MTDSVPNNILTGIADEAASALAGQIAAHQQLGWRHIELRLIDGQNVTFQLSDSDFAAAVDQLGAAGLQVTGFASAIGNWSRPIHGDFALDLEELEAAIPRMQQLGVRYIRTMSWVGDGVDPSLWKKECIRRYRELSRRAEDGGVILAHENCTGWAGLSPENTVELMETVDSPNLAVLFDIGNTISHGLDTIAYHRAVKPWIRYVHVKDGYRDPAAPEKTIFCQPGEGHAQLRSVLGELFRDGYDGVIAIEPHIASIVHLKDQNPDPEQMRTSYLEYGKRFVALVESIKAEL